MRNEKTDLYFLILSLLFSFASCTPKTDEKEENDGTPVSDDTPLDNEDAAYQKYMEDKSKMETTAYVKEKYADCDFDGYSFRILGMHPGDHYLRYVSDETSELWYEEDDADVQKHSVFQRNLLAEDLLNITIKPLWGGDDYETVGLCEKLIKSGGDDFDMMYGPQFKTLPLAMQEYFINLYDIESFNPKNEWWDQDYVETFTMQDDRALFNYDQMGVIFRLREMEGDFGILPMPKLNDEQQEYTSVVNGIWVTTLSVPITSHNTDKIGTIMDVLGGFSTDTVDNTVDEVLLGTRLIRQKRSRDMLKYIVESREYDWAKDIPWGYPIYNLLNDQTSSKTFTLASGLRANIKSIKVQLKGFIKFVK